MARLGISEQREATSAWSGDGRPGAPAVVHRGGAFDLNGLSVREGLRSGRDELDWIGQNCTGE